MDAKDLLRRYLEQRRELGESEFVLDQLTVDDAMRALGVRGTSRAGGASGVGRGVSESVPTLPKGVRKAGEADLDRRERGDDPGVDWRSALRDAGVDPRADIGTPKPRATPHTPPPTPPEGIVAGAETAEIFSGPLGKVTKLEEIAALVAECTRCPLYATALNAVPGEGNPDADLMVVGEAPGATEDETGRPFVGAAGQLLTKILAAINLAREDVFIVNVLKHRPPGNRNPAPNEVVACSPYLVRQIELVRPKVILALGTFAAQTLLDTKTAIGKLRGQEHRYHGVPLVVTYHPAALLRNPSWKRPTWEDVQLARRILDRAAPGA